MSTPRPPRRFQLRDYQRFPVHCIAYFTTEMETGTGRIWNCSRAGLRMDSETPLACGTILKLVLMLPGIQQAIVVYEALVCWSRGQEVGMAIRTMQPQEAGSLRAFVMAHL